MFLFLFFRFWFNFGVGVHRLLAAPLASARVCRVLAVAGHRSLRLLVLAPPRMQVIQHRF